MARNGTLEAARKVFANQDIDLLDGHKVLGLIVSSDTARISFIVDEANENRSEKLDDHSEAGRTLVFQRLSKLNKKG